jgi:hypothetical protein
VASCILITKIPSALLVAVVWLQHTRCPSFRCGTFGYGITSSPSREAEYEYGVSCGCTLVYPSFPMHMLCSACSKVTFILLHKVASKTKKNKLSNEDSIGSLIGTRFSDHKTWWITTSINNALRTLLLNGMFNPGITWFSELPNNVWNYNAD